MSESEPLKLRLRTPSEQSAYYEGVRNGIRLYAWWKDGTQLVGTSGLTLKDALQEINEMELASILMKYPQ